ncbi:MAG: hypothetical protein Q9175_006702 [Cornicularia normoerica]
MADENAAPSVDETPLSPIERQESLEKHLQMRPDAQDLKNRNILRDTNAAPYTHTPTPTIWHPDSIQEANRASRAIQSTQLELERQQATDSLRKGLEKRPEREELVGRNILPDSTAAPAIQGQQKELQKHMRADSLEQKLQQRPKPEELMKEGILDEDPTSPTK